MRKELIIDRESIQKIGDAYNGLCWTEGTTKEYFASGGIDKDEAIDEAIEKLNMAIAEIHYDLHKGYLAHCEKKGVSHGL